VAQFGRGLQSFCRNGSLTVSDKVKKELGKSGTLHGKVAAAVRTAWKEERQCVLCQTGTGKKVRQEKLSSRWGVSPDGAPFYHKGKIWEEREGVRHGRR